MSGLCLNCWTGLESEADPARWKQCDLQRGFRTCYTKYDPCRYPLSPAGTHWHPQTQCRRVAATCLVNIMPSAYRSVAMRPWDCDIQIRASEAVRNNLDTQFWDSTFFPIYLHAPTLPTGLVKRKPYFIDYVVCSVTRYCLYWSIGANKVYWVIFILNLDILVPQNKIFFRSFSPQKELLLNYLAAKWSPLPVIWTGQPHFA